MVQNSQKMVEFLQDKVENETQMLGVKIIQGAVREPLRQHPFGHASTHHLDNTTLFDCYHPSPLNTRTGRLTEQDLIEVLVAARNFARNAPTG